MIQLGCQMSMGCDFHFRDKVPVVILGATGSVGQRFVELLATHPWFEIIAVAASERSIGKKYGDAVNWLMSTPLPSQIASMTLQPCDPSIEASIAFSALDSSVAGTIEKQFAEKGYLVISNAKNHRMEEDVPLLIPEVNSSHLQLLEKQKFSRGRIVTNPNCAAIGLCLALKPLHDKFDIEQVHVVTMQAVSGAGYPGVASMDIMDNIIPFISEEEEKLETEPLKILGTYQEGRVLQASIKISAHCNRVPVTDGHTECVTVKFKNKPSRQEIVDVWNAFSSQPQEDRLPSAPHRSLHYFEERNFPQPKLHRQLDKGMAVSIGRLRECAMFDYKFTLLSHNTVRGAAGGAILCAESLLKKGFVCW